MITRGIPPILRKPQLAMGEASVGGAMNILRMATFATGAGFTSGLLLLIMKCNPMESFMTSQFSMVFTGIMVLDDA